MGKVPLNITVDEETKKLIDIMKDQDNLPSQGDVITKAVEHYRDCKKGEKSLTYGMKEIKAAAYPDTCIAPECENPKIVVGQHIWHRKGVGAMCAPCYEKINAQEDPLAYRKYLKVRYYQRLLQQFMQKVQDAATEYEAYEVPKKQAEIIEQDEKLRILLEQYLQRPQSGSDPESRSLEAKALNRVLDQRDENKRTIEEITAFMDQYVKKRKKKTVLEQIQQQP